MINTNLSHHQLNVYVRPLCFGVYDVRVDVDVKVCDFQRFLFRHQNLPRWEKFFSIVLSYVMMSTCQISR